MRRLCMQQPCFQVKVYTKAFRHQSGAYVGGSIKCDCQPPTSATCSDRKRVCACGGVCLRPMPVCSCNTFMSVIRDTFTRLSNRRGPGALSLNVVDGQDPPCRCTTEYRLFQRRHMGASTRVKRVQQSAMDTGHFRPLVLHGLLFALARQSSNAAEHSLARYPVFAAVCLTGEAGVGQHGSTFQSGHKHKQRRCV